MNTEVPLVHAKQIVSGLCYMKVLLGFSSSPKTRSTMKATPRVRFSSNISDFQKTTKDLQRNITTLKIGMYVII
jgi:hypothetical protein